MIKIPKPAGLGKEKRMPLKKAFSLLFLLLIVIPILGVMGAALLFLNRQFENQAIENIRQGQETIAAGMLSEIDNMSMHLAHLTYVNDGEILQYAVDTDTEDVRTRYENRQRLARAERLTLEPVNDVLSVYFYMKDGNSIYMKSAMKWKPEQVRQMDWYQRALRESNRVCIGIYDTDAVNDLIVGGKKDMMILSYSLSPDISLDRSQKLEMITLYQSSREADRIKKYNREYLQGKNKLGITRITDEAGKTLFSTVEEDGGKEEKRGYTCVRTPVVSRQNRWYIESEIPTAKLTADYWKTALVTLVTAAAVLLFAGFFFLYFIRSIIRPVEAMSRGMRRVEEGDLEVRIVPSGQSEVRGMIHQFNAMVRRLKSLVEEYERKVKAAGKTPEFYLKAMIQGEMPPREAGMESGEFFTDPYVVLGLYWEAAGTKGRGTETAQKLAGSFEKNPRFASRCTAYQESSRMFVVFYRIDEEDYLHGLSDMVRDLRRIGNTVCGICVTACASPRAEGWEQFLPLVAEIRKMECLKYLGRENAFFDLGREGEYAGRLWELSRSCGRLAEALYIADEKNVLEEKEKFFEAINREPGESRRHMEALVMAIGERFGRDHCSLAEVFGQRYDYPEKLRRITDEKSLKMWLANYLAWILDYTASRLEEGQADVIVRTKRYVIAHYMDSAFSLGEAAEYVGLSEKYLTHRFTREAGETFSEYLAGVRIQKARELLRSTSFKVYEIAEMVGYNNAEHFNRMFKKITGMTLSQYRKQV